MYMLGALYRIGICDKCYHLPVLLLLLHLSFLHGLNPFLIPFSREIVKVQASQTRKENHLRPIFCPKGLLIRFGNSILVLLPIVTGGTGIMRGRQTKVCTMTGDMGFATCYCVFMTLCAIF